MHVIYEVELKGFVSQDTAHNVAVQKDHFNFSSGIWPLYVELTNREIIGCDLMIVATGVQPNSDLWARDCHLASLNYFQRVVENNSYERYYVFSQLSQLHSILIIR